MATYASLKYDFGTQLTGAIPTAAIADDAITLAKMAGGTDGNLIGFDASGDPAAIATGTAGQVLTSGGANAASAMADAAGGKIQQMVQLYNTTHTSQTGGGATSWHDISGMSQAITPTKASSKILIQVSLAYSGVSYYTAGKVLADINGGGYNAIGQAPTSATRTKSFTGTMYFADTYVIRPDTGTYLWTPSYTLTDVITFKIQWGANGGTWHLNRSKQSSDNTGVFLCASSITLWEIN